MTASPGGSTPMAIGYNPRLILGRPALSQASSNVGCRVEPEISLCGARMGMGHRPAWVSPQIRVVLDKEVMG